jgi:hypothetical protein
VDCKPALKISASCGASLVRAELLDFDDGLRCAVAFSTERLYVCLTSCTRTQLRQGGAMGIHFTLCLNRQGKARLTKWCEARTKSTNAVLSRPTEGRTVIERRDRKLVHNRHATSTSWCAST